MELSPTAYVILGFLSWRPMCGYEIKGVADESTRFFWAASYGQIYPELRRLSQAGLIEGSGDPESPRRRTVFTLTAEGEARLHEWLGEEPQTFELRDEGLLKLFFASASPTSALATVEAKRAKHLENLERFRELEVTGRPQGHALRVLRYGIEMEEWCVAWCDRALADLAIAREKETV